MVADCLTKGMKEHFLQAIIMSGIWNSEQTAEAKAIKVRKAARAQRRKAERKADDDDAAQQSDG